MHLLNSAEEVRKPKTIGKPMGLAVIQRNFVVKNRQLLDLAGGGALLRVQERGLVLHLNQSCRVTSGNSFVALSLHSL